MTGAFGICRWRVRLIIAASAAIQANLSHNFDGADQQARTCWAPQAGRKAGAGITMAIG
jgi:hypothetical protein